MVGTLVTKHRPTGTTIGTVIAQHKPICMNKQHKEIQICRYCQHASSSEKGLTKDYETGCTATGPQQIEPPEKSNSMAWKNKAELPCHAMLFKKCTVIVHAHSSTGTEASCFLSLESAIGTKLKRNMTDKNKTHEGDYVNTFDKCKGNYVSMALCFVLQRKYWLRIHCLRI